jgi:predicted RNase H-like HicB family nuclease
MSTDDDKSILSNNPKSGFQVEGVSLGTTGHRCQVAITRDDDGGYSAIVLNLPGAGSCGATEDEAIENAKEAVAGVVESYRDDGVEVPWAFV